MIVVDSLAPENTDWPAFCLGQTRWLVVIFYLYTGRQLFGTVLRVDGAVGGIGVILLCLTLLAMSLAVINDSLMKHAEGYD